MTSNQSNIKKSKKYLDNNKCISVPTETVYGLAANAYSNDAVRKIFVLKKRPKNNPLIIHYYSLSNVKNDCILNKKFFLLYKKFCPGPLTFILKLKKENQISKIATNNKKLVAIRFPKHPLLRKLLKKLKYPLAAPSANIYSKLSPVRASDVKDEFGKKIKFILDGGECKIGIESTIINLVGKPKILRLGGLEVGKIKKVLNMPISLNINPKIKNFPGQSKLHYSPGIPLIMNAKKERRNGAFITLKKSNINKKNYFYLSKNGDLSHAAKNLYSTLRKIKKKGYKSISIEKIDNYGMGLAINDRLKRAEKNDN